MSTCRWPVGSLDSSPDLVCQSPREHHQQDLDKNPYGYRCHAKAGVPFPRTD